MHRYKSSSVPFFIFLSIIVIGGIYITKKDHLNSDKKNIEEIVKSVIKNSPEIIMSSIESYQIKIQKELEIDSKNAIIENLKKIKNDNSPVINNDNYDITIIEFFDYNCGYCKAASKELRKILDNDNNIKVIYKELPILGDFSLELAKIALTINKIDNLKYVKFHDSLMSKKIINNETIDDIIANLSIDRELLNKKKSEFEKTIDEELKNNKEFASSIGIRGTPAFIIDQELVPGLLSIDEFKNKIENNRKKLTK